MHNNARLGRISLGTQGIAAMKHLTLVLVGLLLAAAPAWPSRTG